jgi:hypothetical protein
MAELKTQKNDASVDEFLSKIEKDQRRQDCIEVLEIMKEITGEKPFMWGDSIVGFGQYHYKGASGREGDWFITGFSPRKQNLTLYLMAGFDRFAGLMEKLGKYKAGSGCLYVNKLSDLNKEVLETLIKESYNFMKNK